MVRNRSELTGFQRSIGVIERELFKRWGPVQKGGLWHITSGQSVVNRMVIQPRHLTDQRQWQGYHDRAGATLCPFHSPFATAGGCLATDQVATMDDSRPPAVAPAPPVCMPVSVCALPRLHNEHPEPLSYEVFFGPLDATAGSGPPTDQVATVDCHRFSAVAPAVPY